MKVLVAPPAAVRDDQSVEMLRVWIAEQGLHCSVRVGMYAGQGIERETFAWGVMLADAVQHLADAIASNGFGDRDEILAAIVGGFDAEIASPTSRRTGEFVASAA
jgi:hypothetical protein